VVMPVAPMYHANAWGLPYAAPLVGAKLVLPGPALDGHSLWELCEKEGVTFSNGVPTIWQSLLDFLRESGQRLRLPHRSLIGGAAPSPSLLAALEDEYGVELRHGWGMTEISPVGLVNVPKTAETAEQKSRRRVKQGRPVPGIEVKIVDEQGADLPWDGSSFGCLLVRGHWVCSAYFAERADIFRDGGWLVTGDMATIDRDGYVQIVDRAKDIIKSGGEWISSVDLENLACGHPEVQEAAAIGVPDEKWGERPLLIVVRRPGGLLDGPGMIEHLRGRVAKWWLPDRVLFVPSLPRTATGKISKARLRADYAAPAAGPGPTVA